MFTESITIYGREDCIHCEKAKSLAEELAFDYKYIDVPKSGPVLDMFKMKAWRTVPQILIDGHHVGGYDQFKNWCKRNYYLPQSTTSDGRL